MKILLICSAGTSTSLLVSKMKVAAKKRGKNYQIVAMAAALAKEKFNNYDVLLLGPQLTFQLKSFKDLAPNHPVDVVPPKIYGMFDGDAALDFAENLYGKK